MINPRIKPIKIKATTLTPIHISTGGYLDPLDYIMEEGKIYKFEMLKFIKSLTQSEKEDLKTKKDLKELKSFIKTNLDKDICYDIYEISKDLEIEYNEKSDLLENQLKIDEAIRDRITNSLYIPASSLKGAINFDINQFDDNRDKRFNEISISDSIAENSDNKTIYYVLNRLIEPDKKKQGKKQNLFANFDIRVEAIKPKSTFEFTIKLPESVNLSELRKKLNNHYLEMYKSEQKLNFIKAVEGFNPYELSENEFLIRVGRYLGNEKKKDIDYKRIVSYNDFKDKKNKEAKFYSFGWVLCKVER